MIKGSPLGLLADMGGLSFRPSKASVSIGLLAFSWLSVTETFTLGGDRFDISGFPFPWYGFDPSISLETHIMVGKLFVDIVIMLFISMIITSLTLRSNHARRTMRAIEKGLMLAAGVSLLPYLAILLWADTVTFWHFSYREPGWDDRTGYSFHLGPQFGPQ